MALALIKGDLYINQSYFADPSSQEAYNLNRDAYCRFGSGIEGSDTVAVSGVYFWQGINDAVVQFDVATTTANLTQAYFNTLINGTSSGVATGVISLAFTATGAGDKYIIIPRSAVGWFDNTTSSLRIKITCERPRYVGT